MLDVETAANLTPLHDYYVNS